MRLLHRQRWPSPEKAQRKGGPGCGRGHPEGQRDLGGPGRVPSPGLRTPALPSSRRAPDPGCFSQLVGRIAAGPASSPSHRTGGMVARAKRSSAVAGRERVPSRRASRV